MAPERGVHPLQAAQLQVGIECIKALEGRDGHQEVAPYVANHALDLSLVVALGRTSEPVLEQVVGLQLSEGPGAFTPTVSQYPDHRQLGIVVEDTLGHPAQERKGRDVAVQEGLGGLGGYALAKQPSLWGRARMK